jgi:hypothetical protein
MRHPNPLRLNMPSFDILHEGNEIGHVTWTMAYCRKDTSTIAGFVTHPIEEQLGFLGLIERYPAAMLRSITVEPDFQGRKYGSLALIEFENRISQMECHFSVCHVGYDDLEEMNKNLNFYESLDWQIFYFDDEFIFQNRPNDGIEVFCLAYKNSSRFCSFSQEKPSELHFSPTRYY